MLTLISYILFLGAALGMASVVYLVLMKTELI